MKQLALINPRNLSEKDTENENYAIREAARAIVIDENNLVALLHVSRDSYYKLPGGGIDEGEDRIVGLKRECLEEIGCNVEVTNEIGSTLEYWQEDKERQTSYCYLAKVIGEKGLPKFTESENIRGFIPIWLPYEEAIEKIRNCKPTDYEGDYIIPRDLLFLEEAKKTNNLSYERRNTKIKYYSKAR